MNPALQDSRRPLRRPAERLADCCWLPRFIDKTRSLLQGRLSRSYRLAYGSAIGVDGYFLRHFGLTRGGFLRAVRSSVDDLAVAQWFLAQPRVSREAIDAWNRLAPELGARGNSGRAVFLVVRWFLYPREWRRPSKNMFAAIEQDEA